MSKKRIKGKEVRVKSNPLLASFWKNKAHFADLFNTCLFSGKQIINPEHLEEQDTSYSELIIGNEYIETMERIRDVVKMTALGTSFVLLGIENQNKVHYAMPLRTMIYDALGYLKQCKELGEFLILQERNKVSCTKRNKNRKLTSDEFLSAFRKTDRLIAQYTIVIYYGEDDWDGPRSLKEMLTFPNDLQPLVQDYRMNLLEARKVDYEKFQNMDVNGLFHLLHMSKNKKSMLEEDTTFQVSRETLLVAGEVCGIKEWMELAIDSKEEVFQVCTAWEEAKQELISKGKREGEIKAVINLYKKKKITLDIALSELNMKEAEFLQHM